VNARAVHPVMPLVLAVLLVIVLANVFATSFQRLGLAPPVVSTFLLLTMAGSLINVPLWRQRAEAEPEPWFRLGHVVYYSVPTPRTQVIAVNVGGAVAPIALSLWLLPRAPLPQLALAIVLIAALTHRVSTLTPGLGITTPMLVPPVAAGVLGWLLAGGGGPAAAPIAYIAGTLGTLIGADLLNLPRLRGMGPGMLSIGGAGMFDGVFLVGVVAAFLV
jgi:uncharacterized membrane protein